jgi:hypothetical protein
MDRSVIDAAIRGCAEHTGWSEDEVRNVLCAVVAESPDALLDALPEVIAWAKRVEDDAALIAIAKQMPQGVLELRWMGSRVGVRIRPSCNVREVPEGFEILLPGEGAADGRE